MAAAAFFVAFKGSERVDRFTGAVSVEKLLGQHRHIEKTDIDALPGKRVDHMRGIAGQHHALCTIMLSMLPTQWEEATLNKTVDTSKPFREGGNQL